MRIAVSVSAVLLLLILGQAIALLTMYEEMEQDFIDSILAEQLSYSIEVSRHSPELALPNTPTMKLYRLSRNEPLPAELPPAFPPCQSAITRSSRATTNTTSRCAMPTARASFCATTNRNMPPGFVR